MSRPTDEPRARGAGTQGASELEGARRYLAQAAQVLEGISDACVVLDRNWHYVYVNARAGRVFNRRPEDLVGKHIWTEFPEGYGQPFQRAYERAMTEQVALQIEAYYPPWDRWFENRIYPSRDGLVILFQDVTERRVAERERRQLARVLESTRDVVAVGDLDGRLQYLNAAARMLVGASPVEGPTQLTLSDLHTRAAAELLHETALPRAIHSGSWSGETTLRARDGREVPSLAQLTFEPAVQGDHAFVALIARDITERKREEDRARAEARVRAQAERMAHLGLWEWDIGSNRVTWSDELYRIYGLDEASFGASFEAYLARVHPDDRARVRETIERAVRAGEGLTFDERIVRPDGEVRYLHSWSAPKLGADGKVVGLMGACLDTTDLTLATEGMRRSQDWLRIALDAASVALWDWDRARGEAYWSEGVERLFGLKPGEFDRTFEGYMALVHPDDRPHVVAAIEACMARGEDYGVVHRVVAPDGSIRWLEARGRVVLDERGEYGGMAGSIADVTDRRVLEDQLRQSQKMEAIGRLASGVAHDFNNLLTIILTMAAVVGRGSGLSEVAREGLREITDAARRATGLTRQLLTLARQQAVDVTALDVNAVVESMSRMLQRLLPEDVRLEVDAAPGLWSVRGDRGQLEQLMLNLAVNARDAMPSGGRLAVATRNLEVRAGDRRPQVASPGRYVALTFRDNGTGMSPETRARLFEPFFTTKAPGKGTGLGLSMVYGIVQQMGGVIEVDTALGAGTTFSVYLPAEAGAAPTTQPERREPAPEQSAETVLLVDDQDAVRRTVAILVRSMGYAVIEADGARAALRECEDRARAIDLVLTDVGMPEMNGVELAKRIRADRPDIAVVFMSGYADPQVGGTDDPCTAAIAKPFTTDELSRVLRAVLQARAAAAPPHPKRG